VDRVAERISLDMFSVRRGRPSDQGRRSLGEGTCDLKGVLVAGGATTPRVPPGSALVPRWERAQNAGVRGLVFIARSQFRRRAWRLLALAVLVGLVAGLAAALGAGARRSSSVVDRYFASGIPYTLSAFPTDPTASLSPAQVRSMPGVVRADVNSYMGMAKAGTEQGINGLVMDPSSLDPTLRMLRGRPLAPGERRPVVLVNEVFAEEFSLDVGDDVVVRTFANTAAQAAEVSEGTYHPRGPRYRFHIIGLVRTPLDVNVDLKRSPVGSAYGDNNGMIVPAGWYLSHEDEFLGYGHGYQVQLRDPAHDRGPFRAAMVAASPKGSPAGFDTPRYSERRHSFDTPVAVESRVLLALGLAVAVLTALAVVFLIAAEERALGEERPLLTALGATRREHGAIAALRTLPMAVLSAVVAVATAYVLSDRFPIGLGRQLEVDAGRRVDVVIFVALALVLPALVLLAAFVSGRRRVARSSRLRARAAWSHRLARLGAPTEVVVGTNLAFESGSPRRRTTQRAIAAAALAVALVVGVLIVGSGVDDLYARPGSHGYVWDVAVGNVNFSMPKTDLDRLLRDKRFSARTRINYGQATVGGMSTEVLAYRVADTAPPAMLRGRLPVGPGEIALGAKLMDELHAHIGSKVAFSVAGGEMQGEAPTRDRMLTVTGVGVLPLFGESDLGENALVSLDTVREVGGDPAPKIVLARMRRGGGAELRSLDRAYTEEIHGDTVPPRVVNLHRVRTLPLVGVAVAVILGLVLMVHALGVGARARDLAVLRALGMASRRVGRVVAAQAGLFTVLILGVGVPVGLVLGTIGWRAIAHALGISDTTSYPAAIIVVMPTAAALLLAASLWPARRARRVTVSEALRTE
jgi:hypothetical protein